MNYLFICMGCSFAAGVVAGVMLESYARKYYTKEKED